MFNLSVNVPENVRPLQHLCRLTIRKCLGRLRLRAPVFMSFLPLPDRLKEYILYREYDLYGHRNKTQPCDMNSWAWLLGCLMFCVPVQHAVCFASLAFATGPLVTQERLLGCCMPVEGTSPGFHTAPQEQPNATKNMNGLTFAMVFIFGAF